MKRALAIREKILPPNHPDVVRSMLGLANLYAHRMQYAEAEPIFQRCVMVLDEIAAYGTGYPNLPDTLRLYANLLRSTGRKEEAAAMGGPSRRPPRPVGEPQSSTVIRSRAVETSRFIPSTGSCL